MREDTAEVQTRVDSIREKGGKSQRGKEKLSRRKARKDTHNQPEKEQGKGKG